MTDTPIADQIKAAIAENDVILFMKGSPQFPQCGFSANVAQILEYCGVRYASVDVLSDPDVRQGVKDFSSWPTIPQLYVKGEFVGGCDIVRQMFEEGQFRTFLTEKGVLEAEA